MAMADARHPARQELFWWVIEKQMAADIHKKTARGQRVTAAYLMQRLRALWFPMPRSPATEARLARIATDKSTGTNWRRRFRAAWGLTFGAGGPRRQLTLATIKARAAVYLRWLGMEIRRAGPLAIVLNMDETSLTTIREAKNG
jgi:hypothetical protein